jgi:CheY-like chemotaxis protein/anti-sigma regulatory factor (Ser/Thr protein kinase)
MSHEIRTPMTAILGFTDLILDSVDNPQHVDAAQTIKLNGEHLLGIINDILDLSCVEAGKLNLERTAASPCQIVTEVASLMRVRANGKELMLKAEFVGPIPETITTDPTRLRQILINLVGNAVKFTEVGEIRIVTSLVENTGRDPKLQVQVIDTGIGITEEQMAKLFSPFSQADTSTTRRFGGSGLGLAISKRLAETLGGGINVSSVAAEGSTFTLTVATGPLDDVRLLENPAEAVLQAKPSQQPVESNKTRLDCRLLLAEDGPDNQRLIAFLLKKAGAEVSVADNGQIAVEKVLAARDEARPFDVIVMDMQMPVMDRYGAARKLRTEGYTGPIIALTAHAMVGDRQKCLDAGCDDYMTKPIDRKQLVAIVAKHTLKELAHESP